MSWTVRNLFDRVAAADGPLWERELAAAAGEGCPEAIVSEVRRLLDRMTATASRTGSGPAPKSALRIAAERTALLGGFQEIGPYHIRSVLGRGGFGVVFAAEQEEPFRRSVAIKVLDPGKATTVAVQRFESEREALSTLGHPNIAALLDAGATDLGQTFIVMELVARIQDGPPQSALTITEYCDERRLGIEARLELFRTVCDAVQHAHGRGVIHRDLKPSNVLVTELDGRPVPKVIDFGIARLTNGLVVEVTQAGEPLGSLAYMSPEQAKGQRGASVQTDVYGLGVLLYELLSGFLPVDPLSSSRQQAFDSITTGNLPSMLARFTSAASAGGSPDTAAIAAKRGLSHAHLRRLLSGELDWIVRKCMDQRPQNRYPTAAALADDLKAYLYHEPLTAGPQRPWYRAAKLVRRHRVAVGALALVFVAMAAGLAAALYGWQQSRAAQAQADDQIDAIAQHLKTLAENRPLGRPEDIEWARFGAKIAEAVRVTQPTRAGEAYHWVAVLMPDKSAEQRDAFRRSYECLRDSRLLTANAGGVLIAAEGLTRCGEPDEAKKALETLAADARSLGDKKTVWNALLYRGRMDELTGNFEGALLSFRAAHVEAVRDGLPHAWVFTVLAAEQLTRLAGRATDPDSVARLRGDAAATLKESASEFERVQARDPGPGWARDKGKDLCKQLALEEEKQRWETTAPPGG